MRFLLLVTMLVWTLSTSAQTIVQKFSFGKYTLKTQNEHSIFSIPGTRNMAAPGNPAQPYKLTNILLPPGAKVTNVHIKITKKQHIGLNHDLMPMQHVQPLSVSEKHGFIKNQSSYTKTKNLNIGESIIINQERMNGYDIAQIKFSPIEYYPVQKNIDLANELELIVEYKNSKNNNLSMRSARKRVNDRVMNFCDHKAFAKAYKPKQKASNSSIDAIIITPEAFVADFEPLILDYQLRGMAPEVLTVENIQSAYSGADLQEKIRNAIIDYYQNHDVMYVLLGGDVEHIPHRGFFCQVQSSTVYEDDDIPADLYYMALDGNWNTDGDSNWGEPDEDDLIPEIALSRLPFTTHEELAKMLNKINMYANQPVTGELNNPLLAGEHLYDNPLTWGAQYLDLIHGTHDDNGYTTTGIPDSHPFDSLYDRNASWSSGDIIDEINNGHPFIHHVGHSNSNYAMRLYNSDITNSNFNQVDGITHNFPLIYTHGCICGAFDDSDCIAEEMLQIDNFAVAFVGNSRYGWFNEGQTEGPSQHIHREFMNALYGDSIQSLAEAHMISKIETSGWVEAPNQHEYGALRWCFYDCNALGEPLLPIWTNDPRDIEVTVPGNVYVGESIITVNATENGQPAKNIAVVIKMADAFYGTGKTNEAGEAEITLAQPFSELGEIDIISSGYNVLKDTVQETLQRPQEGYLIVSEIDLDGEQQPIYGHAYTPNLLLENVGENASASTLLKVSTENSYVEISDTIVSLEPVNALQQTNIAEAFGLNICDTIPDQQPIELTFSFFENDELTHTMQKTLISRAPVLNWQTAILNDEISGNANGIFDPGEIIKLIVQLENKGSIMPQNVMAHIENTGKNITILNDTVNYIPSGDETSVTMEFAIQASNEQSSGSSLSLVYSGAYDNFALPEMQFNCIVGQALEDFETGDFTKYNWVNDNSFPWEAITEETFEGNFSGCSPDLDHDQMSELSITMDVPEADSISFMYKVSCEDGSSYLWDYLEFSIDGTQIETWDGEIDWNRAAHPVDAGTHTFKWTYTKDGSVSSGDDCAWIDNIMFPIPGYTPPEDNLPPEIFADSEINITEGEAFIHTFDASDPENDPLTATLLLAPEWINMEEANTNEWNINGTAPTPMVNLPDIVVAVGDGYQYAGKSFFFKTNPVGIEATQPAQDKIKIYPQPAADFAFIELQQKSGIQNIQIISAQGKTLVQKSLNSLQNKHRIDLQNMAPGVYVINFQTKTGENHNKKLIVK